MSGKRRLAVFVSAVWIAAIFLWLFEAAASDHRRYGFSQVLSLVEWDGWLIVGVAPVALAWGIAWVVAGFRRR